MTTDNARTTLVVGGTGTTGRRVAARLTALGHPVRIGTRSSNPQFDWGTTDDAERVLDRPPRDFAVFAAAAATDGAWSPAAIRS